MSEHGSHSQATTADHVPHVLPLKSYLGVWLALLGLTALTVGVSYLDFGSWNILVAIGVATLKAGLVAAVFMHLAYEKRKFNAVVFLLSLIFLAIMFGLTFLDTSTRGIGESIEGQRPAIWNAPFKDGKPQPRPMVEKEPPVPEAHPAEGPGPAGK
ncbi:MAG TPA: cytochrome C oxidase subunit IV family protein [Myxococcales bacterium]|jgi:cytochrome c oxidase subunit 4